MNGKLQSLWEDKQKVKIDEVWYSLAEVVSWKYVEPLKGKDVSFSIAEDNPKMITFIKAAQPGSSGGFKKPFEKSFEKKPYDPQRYSETQDQIGAQWAINTAFTWIEKHNQLVEKEKQIPYTESKIREFAISLKNIRDNVKSYKKAVEITEKDMPEEEPPEDY